jgi:hypothetical protein
VRRTHSQKPDWCVEDIASFEISSVVCSWLELIMLKLHSREDQSGSVHPSLVDKRFMQKALY